MRRMGGPNKASANRGGKSKRREKHPATMIGMEGVLRAVGAIFPPKSPKLKVHISKTGNQSPNLSEWMPSDMKPERKEEASG